MSRPYFNDSIDALEQRFATSAGNIKVLQHIREELLHRSTDRARRCLAKVESKLAVAKDPQTEASSASDLGGQARSNQQGSLSGPDAVIGQTIPRHSAERPPESYPPVTNDPLSILSSWIAMEVLSPQSYRKPENLSSGGEGVASFARKLPWDPPAERSRSERRLYYQVVFGAAHVDVATAALLAKYGDSRFETFPTKAKVPLAVLLVDKSGIPAEPLSLGISSFAWGVSTALKEDLSKLSEWKEFESACTSKVEKYLTEALKTETGAFRALDAETISGVFRLLCATFELPAEFFEAPTFATRIYVYYRERNLPELMLLNSFFLPDLLEARRLIAAQAAPANLRRYLGASPSSPQTADLLENVEALRTAVSPSRTPLARWPAKGRHPLVLLQQAAVNLALSECAEGGLAGVNGPPGTGKTTLLRDLVAGIVTNRATAMARFDDPAKAFRQTSHSVNLSGGTVYLYDLDPGLRGFEMLVASSNNKAVENVSAELPSIDAIAGEATELRYFPTLATSLFGREAWGVVAGVLGNRKNQAEFRSSFWQDKDFGLSTYLAAAIGGNPQVDDVDPSGYAITRKPRIVEHENPPTTHAEALQRWNIARERFSRAIECSSKWQQNLHQLEDDIAHRTSQEQEAESLRITILTRQKLVEELRAERHRLTSFVNEARQAEAAALAEHQACVGMRPGVWARLFGTKRWRQWREVKKACGIKRDATAGSVKEAEVRVERNASKIEAAGLVLRTAMEELEFVERLLGEARVRLEAAREHGIPVVDSAFLSADRETINKAVPWFPEEALRARDDVFIAAMALHRAFVDAAAKPLRYNIEALIGVAALKVVRDAGSQQLMPALWSSLFLVVPLISTTFASVNQMLGRLPAESLGWLFVDEAGQALPQAVVGALMKTRRAVVVGDPIQLEPFTGLPDQLTTAIFRRMGVDPDTFAPPSGSVQTLADLRSKYTAEFPTEHGSRRVGIPLLVHRRCSEPMFSISNSVAYAGLMVQAKQPKPSAIASVLGPSSWIHIEGSGADKWCPEEGECVLHLLRRLENASIPLDLYIITPFVVVEQKMRELIRESGILRKWIPDWEGQSAWLRERVGTVHTVQGREAEAVILVLGAPNADQIGARNWAGGRPNLLNVAVTRAKESLYVVGNQSFWRRAGLFSKLDQFMEASCRNKIAQNE